MRVHPFESTRLPYALRTITCFVKDAESVDRLFKRRPWTTQGLDNPFRNSPDTFAYYGLFQRLLKENELTHSVG